MKSPVIILSILAFLSVLSCSKGYSDYQIIPLPNHVAISSEAAFVLNRHTSIVYDSQDTVMARNARFLSDYISEMTGIRVGMTTKGSKSKNIIRLTISEQDNQSRDAYSMVADSSSITISGNSHSGVFYGIQTLRKSLPAGRFAEISCPAVEITDCPRFEYRGMMLDVSRHFFSADFVKRYIDIMVLHNINTFHWHLSDDQGWRVEIKKYPKLTSIGSKREQTVIGQNTGKYDGIPYSGYYTQEQIRDIVKYAAERYVTIIPEIDMPGHMQAALSAYPELGCTKGPYKVWQQWGISDDVLCAGNDTTVGFVEDVLSEIMELFPSEYIHIGGDECPKIRWEQCPACQQRIKNENIKATEQFTKEQGLQSWFMRRIEQYLNEHGRSIIGWDEILEGGLSPTATVMSWRSTSGGIEAAKMGNKVIMVPNQDLYFNYYQTLEIDNEPLAIGGYVPIENVYNLEPVPVDLPQEAKDNIIGLQANLWTEYIGDESLVEYMVLPRMAALSEVQWCNPENKSYHGFLKRIFRQFKIYSHLGYNYATQLLDVRMDLKSENGTVSVTMSTIDNADIYYTLDGTDPDINSEKYSAPIRIQRNCELRAVAIRGEKISKVSKEVFTVSETTGKPINVKTPPHRQYGFGGPNTLVDGLRGNINYRTGRWIGYYAQDFEADLTTNAEISYVSVNVCVNKGDGCFDIRGIRVYGRRVPSDEFSLIASADYPPMNRESPNSEIINHTVMFPPVDFNVLRVVLLHEHSMPEWQSNWGAGQPAFIFIDEIEAGYSMSFPGRQNPPQR